MPLFCICKLLVFLCSGSFYQKQFLYMFTSLFNMALFFTLQCNPYAEPYRFCAMEEYYPYLYYCTDGKSNF